MLDAEKLSQIRRVLSFWTAQGRGNLGLYWEECIGDILASLEGRALTHLSPEETA